MGTIAKSPGQPGLGLGSSTAYVGHASVRLPLDPSAVGTGASSIALESRFYAVEPNKRYTLAAWVRSDMGLERAGAAWP